MKNKDDINLPKGSLLDTIRKGNKDFLDSLNPPTFELKGYAILPYNIGAIHVGVQALHAAIEYVLKYFHTDPFQNWARMNKTLCFLNGGTSCHTKSRYSDEPYIGSMEEHAAAFKENGINFGTFYEPDMNNMLSGIFLIADERIWDFKKYPDWEPGLQFCDGSIPTIPDEWIKNIGGKKNYFLREYLRKMNLWRP